MKRGLAAVAAIALAAVSMFVLSSPGEAGSALQAAQASDTWTPQPGKPFKPPVQVARPPGDGPKVIDVNLTAHAGETVIAGSPVWARTYNGGFVGPTVHARPGDTIKVRFTNDLGGVVPTNIHYHGMHVSPLGNGDNVFVTIEAGKIYESSITLPAKQPTGTFWYHAHFHGISDGQIMGGLSGLLIVEGLKPLLPAALRHVPERQIALRDVQLGTAANQPEGVVGPYIAQNPDILVDPKATYRMVNGMYKPKFAMHTGKYELWHLANIGSDVFYKLEFVDQRRKVKQKFAIVTTDGIPVWDVTRPTELLLPPGKRFDVLVAAQHPGTYELKSDPYVQTGKNNFEPRPAIPCEIQPDGSCVGFADTLATVDVNGASTTPPALPEHVSSRKRHIAPGDPPYLEDLSKVPDSEVVRHRLQFRYETVEGGKFTPTIMIDNDPKTAVPFEHDEMPVVSPVLGQVDEWSLVNTSRDDHPFHIHINGFQVMSVRGDPNFKAHGHQDVVNIPRRHNVKDADGNIIGQVNGKVVIRQRYENFHGWFVFHCHILNHEDLGMMHTIQVREKESDPVTPPPETDDHSPHAHTG
ncbi:MAG: hypothetical protein QOI48_980 [Solirubrobacteraceae bacterium]|jgi:FtsP/CotA-like multicopper oxidase with cupredoxin domain|nr:hypothetical protein [Solirubrobacteraceae bacterium]